MTRGSSSIFMIAKSAEPASLKRRADMIPLRFIVLVDFSVCGSCHKFCDNWVFRRHHSLPNTVRVRRKRTDIRKGRVEFFSQGIRNMFADGLYVTSEEFRHLLPIQPSRCAINPDFKPKRRIRLIDDNLTLTRHVACFLRQSVLTPQIHAHIIPFLPTRLAESSQAPNVTSDLPSDSAVFCGNRFAVASR